MLQKGDIILTYQGNLYSRLIVFIISFFQREEVNYSHVIIVTNDNAGCEALLTGIKIIPNMVKKLSKIKKYKIIRYKNATNEERDKLALVSSKLVGLRYSLGRIILQLLDNVTGTNFFTKLLKNKKYQVCSSLVAWAYYCILKVKFNSVSWHSCEPDDIDDESGNRNLWKIIQIQGA